MMDYGIEMNASQFTVKRSNDVLKSVGRIFTKLTPVMYYGTERNAIKFCSQKVKVQGRGGITYAGTITVQACST